MLVCKRHFDDVRYDDVALLGSTLKY